MLLPGNGGIGGIGIGMFGILLTNWFGIPPAIEKGSDIPGIGCDMTGMVGAADISGIGCGAAGVEVEGASSFAGEGWVNSGSVTS